MTPKDAPMTPREDCPLAAADRAHAAVLENSPFVSAISWLADGKTVTQGSPCPFCGSVMEVGLVLDGVCEGLTPVYRHASD